MENDHRGIDAKVGYLGEEWNLQFFFGSILSIPEIATHWLEKKQAKYRNIPHLIYIPLTPLEADIIGGFNFFPADKVQEIIKFAERQWLMEFSAERSARGGLAQHCPASFQLYLLFFRASGALKTLDSWAAQKHHKTPASPLIWAWVCLMFVCLLMTKLPFGGSDPFRLSTGAIYDRALQCAITPACSTGCQSSQKHLHPASSCEASVLLALRVSCQPVLLELALSRY